MTADVAAALRLKLGALNVQDGPKTPFAATVAVFPGSESEAADCIALARQGGMRVICAGGGTYVDALAPLPAGSMLLSSIRLNRIIEHQPENLIVTAEAGVTLTALQEALRRHHQYLPLNPPDPDIATLGGIVSTAATGSWRAPKGAVRDYLLEVRCVDGLARPIRAGARVMKNVAGYDMPKLYAGSRGTLAFITQVTFKVKPLPEQVTRLLFSAASWDVVHDRIAALAFSDVRPTVIEVVRPDVRDAKERPSATITLEGSVEAVQWQVTQSTALLRGEGALIGRVDVSPVLPRAGDVEATVRVKPCDTIEALGIITQVGWRGSAAYYPAEGRISLRCTSYPDTLEQIEAIRAYAEAGGGAVVLERMPRNWEGSIHPFGSPRPDARLAGAIKAKLDPDSVFGTLTGE